MIAELRDVKKDVETQKKLNQKLSKDLQGALKSIATLVIQVASLTTSIERDKQQSTSEDYEDIEQTGHSNGSTSTYQDEQLTFTFSSQPPAAQPQKEGITLVVGDDPSDISVEEIASGDINGTIVESEVDFLSSALHNTINNQEAPLIENKSQDDSARKGATHAEIVANTHGPWNKGKAPKKMTITFDRKGKQRKIVPYSPHRTTFIGRKWVHSTTMYLKNIDRGDMNDEELSSCISQYAKSIGIRIMQSTIVSNRYAEDIVGCRIRIPSDEVDKALDSDTWPEDIECRKWSREKPSRRSYEEENWEY